MPMTELLIEVARGALAILIAALGIYLSLRLMKKLAKYAITLIVIAVIVYFIFAATDISQIIQNAGLPLSLLPIIS